MTEREDRAAGVLGELRLHVQTIVDMVRDALLVLNGELRVQFANRTFYEKIFPMELSVGEYEDVTRCGFVEIGGT
jgi:PAS domain-containing protein